ncbi:hypothetical protein G6F50_010742 [Rhizopus delemar]|uniref:Uncharacterized protein n=2 Tax=Rhizopus TaxID=4842 RepID=A0A9P6YU94_9FUNG|nr:hypothetical protein G6F51_011600 [Rhizopus arrhizus]KAG1564728.1 hypothetical protein G6F50_010742 [Rhizopus delemar]
MLPDLPKNFDNKVTDVSQLNLEADESEMIVCYTTSTTNNEETAEGNIDETEENDNTEQDEQCVDIVESPLDDLDRRLHGRIRMRLAGFCAELNKSKDGIVAHNIDESFDEAVIYPEASETEGDLEEESNYESDTASSTDKVISQVANLATDDHGFNENFDLVTNYDIGFMEVTIRYFLDLMSSPNSPLNTIMLERTAATYLIIYVVNQLFIANNDVIELVGNKSIGPGLVEFSGGINDKTSSLKYTKDIGKLYSNMIKAMVDSKADKMFCIRCYGHHIYFEKLVNADGVMYRTVDVNMEIPTTPRKLIAYINEIPRMLAWKQTLINHAISLN